MRPSLLCLVLLFVGACAHQDRNVALAVSDLRYDYGYRGHAIEGQKMTDTLLILTLSGGGTRAAALAQGVLRELQATPIGGGRTMLDEIDIISSVSGGSVTAGNFVANGPESFDAFETGFVRQDFHAAIDRRAHQSGEPRALCVDVGEPCRPARRHLR